MDNGLRVITATMPHIRSVSTCIFVGVGSRYEPDTEAGTSHLIEHMLFKGTPARPTPRDIAEAIEGVGGIINGATGREVSLYWCKVANSHFHQSLDVLADMLLNSKFDPADMAREQQIIIDEINMTLDTPSQRVEMLIDELLWPNHPLGRDVAGSRESVNAITRETTLKYLHSQYQPANIVVSIAGNIEHRAAVTAVSRAFGNWTSQEPRAGYLPYEDKPAPRLSHETPRRFALDLLNVILGEGMSSRLFTEIRDRLGLAYSISSHSEHYHDSGSITIYAGVEPDKVETAIRAILEQLALLKKSVSGSELSRAKELTTGRLMLGMEDSRAVAGWLGGQEILNREILTADQIVSMINAVTLKELTELARELIVDRQLRLALVGPITNPKALEGLLTL